MDLLKFFTCGNVDDGKSTLIGRLLYDSGSVSTDILQTLARQSKTVSEGTGIDLALLTDGLRAEREQGITIDVAYKYFSTPRRNFIIVDTPGHVEYTRNMVTGASNCDLAIVLIDARHGLTEQTRRHSILASLLGLPHLLVCVNKMDLAGYSQKVFDGIRRDFEAFAVPLAFHDVKFLPVVALAGDNVVHPSAAMPWYGGPTLLQALETAAPGESGFDEPRFFIQYVIRPQTPDLPDYRGLSGQVLSGRYRVGDEVTLLPSGRRTRITRLENRLAEVAEVTAGQSAVIHLVDGVDAGRGNSLAVNGSEPRRGQGLEAVLCWMSSANLRAGQRFLLQHQTHRVRAVVRTVDAEIDVQTYRRLPPGPETSLNSLVLVTLKTAEPLGWDPYLLFRKTGGFILIDEDSHATVAAGMLQDNDRGMGL